MSQLRGKDTVVDASLKEIKSHGTEGMPLAVYLNDFASFQTDGICWHWHDELQITMITEGAQAVMMGNVIFFNSRFLHQISPCEKGVGKLYSFLWRPEILGGRSGSDLYRNCVEAVTESHLKYAFFPLGHPANKRMQSRLQRIIRMMVEKARFYELRVNHQLSGVWMNICEYMDSSVGRDPKDLSRYLAEEKDEEKIKDALGYIQGNYHEKITLESIAKAAMTNRSELCRCFRRVLDTTPNEFLTRYRLDRALELLENPELRISDIAELTGFCSPSYFGSQFVKYMGCTPLQYRKTLL